MIRLDANGLPLGHEQAVLDAARELRDWVNELPDSVYHLGPTDAELVTRNMLQRYLHSLGQTQRAGLRLVGGQK